MRLRFVYGLILVLMLSFVFSSLVIAATLDSTSSEFSSDTDTLEIEWYETQGNITLTNNNDYNITLDIVNDTSPLTNSLSQTLNFAVYNGTEWDNSIFIQNQSSVEVMLNVTPGADPGHYAGNLVIKNSTNSSENISNLEVQVDIPITFSSSGTATVYGNMSEGYYFNATAVSGSTGLVVQTNDSLNIQLSDGPSSVVATNYTSDRLQYFDFDGLGMYGVNVGGKNVEFKAELWLIPFNITNVSNFDSRTGDLDSLDLNFNRNTSRNLTFTISNPGDHDYNITDITEGILRSDTHSSQNISFTHNLTSNVSQGQNYLTVINYTADTNNAVSDGPYTGYLGFNLTNEDLWAKLNLSLNVELVRSFDIDITNVEDGIDSNNLINMTGSYLEIATEASYFDGGAVSLENISNFTEIKLITSYVLDTIETDYELDVTPIDDLNWNETNGIYDFNASVENSSYGGNFTLNVEADDGLGNTGTGQNAFIYIDGSMIVLDAIPNECDGCNEDVDDDEVYGEDDDDFKIDLVVTNYGNQDVENLVIKISAGTCTELRSGGELGTDTTFTINDLPAYSNNTTEDAWELKLEGTTDCSVRVYKDTTNGSWVNTEDTISIDLDGSGDLDDSNNDDNNDSPDSGSGSLSIYSLPDSTTVPRGSDKTITVKVRNTLDGNLGDLELWIDYLNQSWYQKPATFAIASSQIKNIDLKFTVPIDAEEGEYSIKFVVNNSATTARKTSKLIVGPPEEICTADEASTRLDTAAAKYDELVNMLVQIEGKGVSMNETEEKLNATRDKIDDAAAYIEIEDYDSACVILTTIESDLSGIETTLSDKLSELVAGEISFWTPIAVLVVIVVVIGVVIFVVTPPKAGYRPGQGYKHVPDYSRGTARGKSFIKKIKEAIDRRKRHSHHYSYYH